MRNEKHSSTAFLPNFWLFPWPTVQHWSKNTCKTLPSLFFWCSLPLYQVSSRLEHFEFFLFQGSPLCIIFRFWSLRPQQGARTLQNHYPAYFCDAPYQSCKFRPDWSTLNFFCSKGTPFASFFVFGRSDPNKVQANFKITSQLIFLMVPTSPASFVQIGALWIFFLPRVPPLDIFRILIKCKKNCIFCFSRYGPHFLTRYSGLPQEQF